MPPRPTHGCSSSATRSSSSSRTFDPGLSTNAPLTRTRPAMISDCAFERVSTSPRSTSATSRRARFGAVMSLLTVAARRRIGDGARRDALDGPQHAARDRLIARFGAVVQHVVRFFASIQNRADVERAVALIAPQQQDFAHPRMRVQVLRIDLDRFVEQGQDVLVKNGIEAFMRPGDFFLDAQQLFGGGGQALTQCGGGKKKSRSDHRIVASRGRAAPSCTNSRTRRAMPSGWRSYWARRTSCVPWWTYSSGIPILRNRTSTIPSCCTRSMIAEPNPPASEPSSTVMIFAPGWK